MRTTITISTPAGSDLTAEPEAWIGVLIVSLPSDLRDKVFANVQKHIAVPIVGAPARPSLLVSPPLGLTVRKA